MHERAGSVAQPDDLIDLDALLAAYADRTPDLSDPAQRVAFGTSGHRGSSLDGAFTDAHIAAITQAIVEYRAAEGVTGPVYVGADTHALSAPAQATVLEVLAGNGVVALVDVEDRPVPTPAVSRAIIAHNREYGEVTDLADGIVITPSHNPPRDGGIKYNPPHGGPADTDATGWIAARANELLESGNADVLRADAAAEPYDYVAHYVDALPRVLNIDAIRESGVRLGADPLGGASVPYWEAIRDRLGLNVTVVNETMDPRWAFMTLDWDGKIRMDPSSPHAMASLLERRHEFDVLTGNDADADRHGIVTPDAGLMNPNHYLAVAIDYLVAHRPEWPQDAAVGKTLVSSTIIDRVVASLGRDLLEVPVGFKWFVPGLADGSVVFGGEESAGASFLTHDGEAWSTDKDGILLALLAAEIIAVTGQSPSARYRELTERFGDPVYARVDAAATPELKKRLAGLSAADVTATELAGEAITAILTEAPGNGAAIGGLKVTTDSAWFAARPSGTENVYKIYGESFIGPEHLAEVQRAAQQLVG